MLPHFWPFLQENVSLPVLPTPPRVPPLVNSAPGPRSCTCRLPGPMDPSARWREGVCVCVWTEVVKPRCTEQYLPTKVDTRVQLPCVQAIGDAVAKAHAGAGAFFIAHDWVNQYQVCYGDRSLE
jgi:hypothetical protein